MNARSPIGVFDSGVGGLTVLREIRALMPNERVVFAADGAHVPYGGRPPAYIEERSLTLTRFLVERGAKAIVVACNTATAAAVEPLRARFAVPVVGMEPAVRPAAAQTKTGVVGVLATAGTLNSERFTTLLKQFGREIAVITQPAPQLVERVEAGELDGPAVHTLVARYTEPLLAEGADTIVLGSTHFAFLRPLMRKVLGPDVTVIDTGKAVASRLAHVLEEQGLANNSRLPGSEEFWTSGEPTTAQDVVCRLWGKSVKLRRLPRGFA